MQKVVILLIVLLAFSSHAQLSCESIQTTGVSYSLSACRNGKAKLFNTDTAITNRFKYAQFELNQLKNMPQDIQEQVKRYKIALKPDDTCLVYDWDIMHQAKLGYFGPAIGKVKFECKDSTLHIYKYLLQKETGNYVPTRFKIFKMGKDNFILNDKDHPYLNINYYFKQKVH